MSITQSVHGRVPKAKPTAPGSTGLASSTSKLTESSVLSNDRRVELGAQCLNRIIGTTGGVAVVDLSTKTGPAAFGSLSQTKVVILRLKDVKARVGLGRSSIYGLMDRDGPYHDPQFPRSVKISAHAVGWVESEINCWLEARVAASRAHEQAGRSLSTLSI